jgi:hypothetical protein
VAWLESNSGQLGALTLTGSSSEQILAALAQAAAAAQAAGRRLPLHTLRVLGTLVSSYTTGQLLAGLPHLRCLQLGLELFMYLPRPVMDMELVTLAPLQQATQLEELYLESTRPCDCTLSHMLPTSVRRLAWHYPCSPSPDLSHLTKCTYLHLSSCRGLSSSQSPPGMQQLELMARGTALEVVEEHQEVVTSWAAFDLEQGEAQQLLARLPNLTAVSVDARHMLNPATQAALKQANKVSVLTVFVTDFFGLESELVDQAMRAMVDTAASMRSLRCLDLGFSKPPDRCPGVAALKHLTQLRVSIWWQQGFRAQWQRAWVEELGRLQGLQWLSVPAVLVGGDRAWLGGLQQLRVLVIHHKPSYEGAPGCSMAWLEGCPWEALPGSLQVLGVSGMTAHEATTWQLRRRLQQALGSRGCEVVVGVGWAWMRRQTPPSSWRGCQMVSRRCWHEQ